MLFDSAGYGDQEVLSYGWVEQTDAAGTMDEVTYMGGAGFNLSRASAGVYNCTQTGDVTAGNVLCTPKKNDSGSWNTPVNIIVGPITYDAGGNESSFTIELADTEYPDVPRDQSFMITVVGKP